MTNPTDTWIEEKCTLCGSGRRMSVKNWNECPVHKADWNAATKWCFIPRAFMFWWYFRNNPKHLTLSAMREKQGSKG